MNPRRYLRPLPWLALILIGFATLSSLEMRPRIDGGFHLEHFGAFWLLGFLFAAIYPKRIYIVLLLVKVAAVCVN